jgi:hypothetical protein
LRKGRDGIANGREVVGVRWDSLAEAWRADWFRKRAQLAERWRADRLERELVAERNKKLEACNDFSVRMRVFKFCVCSMSSAVAARKDVAYQVQVG